MSHTIDKSQLKQLMDNGNPLTIIEALPFSYYKDEHIPGAINLPHDEVASKASSLIPDQSQAIVVYCANAECKNSAIAGETLRKLGYRNVLEYNAGKKDWKAAGMPLRQGERP